MLDVGGGSARIGELTLEHGASRYVDVDLSDSMLELAKQRLERFEDEKVTLIQGDFLRTAIPGSYDVILGLGYFDYIENAPAHVRRMRELIAPSGSVVASFPRWTWTKGPIRKLRYEVINNCPIFNYTRDGLMQLFADFSNIEIRPGKSGFSSARRRRRLHAVRRRSVAAPSPTARTMQPQTTATSSAKRASS